MAARENTKHRQIYDRIYQAIVHGQYAPGERIPTESELMGTYGVSRPTIARALRDLEQKGLLTRRRGVGTFVRTPRRSAAALLGLTIPPSEGGIMAAVCTEIVHRAEENGFGILFGGTLPRHSFDHPASIESWCERFTTHDVSGVFFVPHILPTEQMHVNELIVERLVAAGIAVVLLDRDIMDYPRRSPYDLVGVDNRRNGYILTAHLLKHGCRRIDFVTLPLPVSTSTARLAGYHDALRAHDLAPGPDWIHHWTPPGDPVAASKLLCGAHADAYVCLNDDLARTLMHHLAMQGVRVPDEVRIVGFDDLPAAATLPVPLTTMHQPTREIGAAAMETMLSRLAAPGRPARDVMLACDLVVRTSCGALRFNHTATSTPGLSGSRTR
ncbi:MAG: GntR family transcriptional regulator [Phycisphaerales bacterium]|nr:GntR family transcriptional regulator [Phycisphaerales bacterium]